VQIRSPFGQVKVQVLISDRVQGKQLYMPINSVLEPVNNLTSSEVDRVTHTPAYKETSVKMIVLEETGSSPLPRENFRYGKRTPQMGVEVERKWKQPAYWVPGTRREDELVQIKSTTV
jgi:formate dehydrogenase major subunit